MENNTYKNAFYQGIHFRLGWKQQKGSDIFDQIYNSPVYGIGFYTGSFYNDVIGNPFAIYGFVQVPIKADGKNRFSYDYRIGLGLSGNFDPYDKQYNPLNLAIGSAINVFIDFGLRAHYSLAPKWKAGLGISFHLSNGALALPNKGLNPVPLSVLVSYQPRQSKPSYSKFISSANSKKWLYLLSIGMGLKQLNRENDEYYYKSTLSFYVSRHVSQKWQVSAGADIFYSSSGNDPDVAGRESGNIRSILSGGPSIYLAHILNERLLLNGNIGSYLHRQSYNGEISNIFLRAGFRYYVYRNLNAGVSIKAHTGKADFIEWSFGYTFRK